MTGVVLASVRDLVLLLERLKNLLISTWSSIGNEEEREREREGEMGKKYFFLCL